jgi:hypothetical protein
MSTDAYLFPGGGAGAPCVLGVGLIRAAVPHGHERQEAYQQKSGEVDESVVGVGFDESHDSQIFSGFQLKASGSKP